MRRGDLFVLSWESLRRVEWGKVSSFLSMSGGGLFNSLLMGHIHLLIDPIIEYSPSHRPHHRIFTF